MNQEQLHCALGRIALTRDNALTGSEDSLQARMLLSRILAEPRPAQLQAEMRSRRHWPFLPPRATVAASIALTLVVAAVSMSLIGSSSQNASAATILQRIAVIAGSRRALSLGPRQFYYTKEVGLGLVSPSHRHNAVPDWTALVHYTIEVWQGHRSGRELYVNGDYVFTGANRAKWLAAGSPSLTQTGYGRRSDSKLYPTELAQWPWATAQLPTNVDALERYLKKTAQRYGKHQVRSGELFNLIAASLRWTDATAKQREALFLLAARLPNVQVIGRQKDSIGRIGIAVAVDDRVTRSRDVMIFNPKTSALLAEEGVTLSGFRFGYPPGTRLSMRTYVRQGIVNSTKARP